MRTPARAARHEGPLYMFSARLTRKCTSQAFPYNGFGASALGRHRANMASSQASADSSARSEEMRRSLIA
jgi:hypothetical protein